MKNIFKKIGEGLNKFWSGLGVGTLPDYSDEEYDKLEYDMKYNPNKIDRKEKSDIIFGDVVFRIFVWGLALFVNAMIVRNLNLSTTYEIIESGIISFIITLIVLTN